MIWFHQLLQVELATGVFPYKNCKTDFDVLAKILQEDPPLLPPGQGFSMDFCGFVRDWYAPFIFNTYLSCYYFLP